MKILLLPIIVFASLFFVYSNSESVEFNDCPANSTYVASSCTSGCYQVVPVMTGSLEIDVQRFNENPPRALTIAEYQMVQEALDDYCNSITA